MTTVLVLGGARSGKSRYAEHLLAAQPAVRYVAPGPLPDPAVDPEWAARVRAHQRSRPAGWETVETGDVPGVLRRTDVPVLVDCLGTWVARLLDDARSWDDRAGAERLLAEQSRALVSALASARSHVVLVSNETGLGVVPASPSGRLFRDGLGRVNAAVADVCERVALVVAGRVWELGDQPRIAQTPRLAPTTWLGPTTPTAGPGA